MYVELCKILFVRGSGRGSRVIRPNESRQYIDYPCRYARAPGSNRALVDLQIIHTANLYNSLNRDSPPRTILRHLNLLLQLTYIIQVRKENLTIGRRRLQTSSFFSTP